MNAALTLLRLLVNQVLLHRCAQGAVDHQGFASLFNSSDELLGCLGLEPGVVVVALDLDQRVLNGHQVALHFKAIQHLLRQSGNGSGVAGAAGAGHAGWLTAANGVAEAIESMLASIDQAPGGSQVVMGQGMA